MRKYLVIVAVFLLLIISLVQTVAQNVTFHQNDQVVIKSGISYVWLRGSPTSDCACVEYVITSPKRILRILDTAPVSDGIQNWWRVSTIARPIKQGWVEEKSIRLLKSFSVPTPAPNSTLEARHFKTNAVQIREGVPFIWIRDLPSASTASAILQTIKFTHPKNYSECLTLAYVGPVVKWDGQQWWRSLVLSTGVISNFKTGWVEENSLVDCNPEAASSTVTITPTFLSDKFITPLPPVSTYAAYQAYENGIMIWRQDDQTVYVLANNGSFLAYLVSDYAGMVVAIDVPPAGRYTPVNAFGKVWNGAQFRDASVRDMVGWATAPEVGYTAAISGYSNGCFAKCDTRTTISLPDGRTAELSTAFFSWKLN